MAPVEQGHMNIFFYFFDGNAQGGLSYEKLPVLKTSKIYSYSVFIRCPPNNINIIYVIIFIINLIL